MRYSSNLMANEMRETRRKFQSSLSEDYYYHTVPSSLPNTRQNDWLTATLWPISLLSRMVWVWPRHILWVGTISIWIWLSFGGGGGGGETCSTASCNHAYCMATGNNAIQSTTDALSLHGWYGLKDCFRVLVACRTSRRRKKKLKVIKQIHTQERGPTFSFPHASDYY